MSCASASSSSAATLSTAPARACIRAPPSSSLSGASPIPAIATTGGPATNSWAVSLTITEKCEHTTRAAPSPATGPSAAAATGTIDRFFTTRSNPGSGGTYEKPICSSVLTLPPPPVPSTSRTSGRRRSWARRSA